MATPRASLVQTGPTEVRCKGRRLIYFGGSDYLRLGWHPRVLSAAVDTLVTSGLNVAASRTTTGNHPLYPLLENALARFFKFPAATLASCGYTAPLIAAQAIKGQYTDVLVSDKAHGCVQDAATLTGARVQLFPHGDSTALKARHKSISKKGRVAVFTDGLSPLDGTLPPLAEYLALLPRNGLLLVDDAHGAGTLGKHGRGSLELCGLRDPRVVLTLTMSKALGAYGGAVLSTAAFQERLQKQSRAYAGNTPLPLPCAAAALEALRVLREEGDALRTQLQANLLFVRESLRDKYPEWTARPGPTMSIVPPNAKAAEMMRKALLKRGIYPTLIQYAAGPAKQFFRFAISSAHTPRQLLALCEVIR